MGKIHRCRNLKEEIIDAIDKCEHRLEDDNNVQVWCGKSGHDCHGFEKGEEGYTENFFECLCLIYAGLCPSGLKAEWEWVEMEEIETSHDVIEHPESPKCPKCGLDLVYRLCHDAYGHQVYDWECPRGC